MPASTFTFRTAGQAYSSPGEAYLPFYTVLFYCAPANDWNGDLYGGIDFGSFRRYYEVMYPRAIYRLPDGTDDPSLVSNPLIKCVSNDSDWISNTGICYAATSDMPTNSGTLLNTAGAHTPTTLPRSSILLMHGFKAGDTASTLTTDIYYGHNKTSGGHFQRVDNIKATLLGAPWGEVGEFTGESATSSDYIGIKSSQSELLLLDPKLPNLDTRVTSLPKGVMVFGASLPTEYYTRTDPRLNPGNGSNLPIIAKVEHAGVIGPDQFTGKLFSNTAPGHNHIQAPPPTITANNPKRLSNKTNQVAYVNADGGEHQHEVVYQFDVNLKRKVLKSWFTSQDEAPIANGIILAYSIGLSSGYDGTVNNTDTLPPNWHFCDGSNGTPDLRGYYIYSNINNGNDHDVAVVPGGGEDGTLTVSSITVSKSGNHAHLSNEIGQATTRIVDGNITIAGTPIDNGNHTFEPNNGTINHTHPIATVATFLTETGTTLTNIKVGSSFSYTPPTLELAFIMYNENIV